MTQPVPIVTPGRTVTDAPNQHPSPITTGRFTFCPARAFSGPIWWVTVQMVTEGPIATLWPITVPFSMKAPALTQE